MEAKLKASPVRFSAAREGYVNRAAPHIRLRGLLPLLRECFWEKYKYKADREAAAASTDKTSSREGRKRGSRVDREFQAIISGHPPKKIHPFVKRGWSELVKKKYTPVAAQVGVAAMDKSLRVATAADMVCQFKDKPGAVLVEVKVRRDVLLDWSLATMDLKRGIHF